MFAEPLEERLLPGGAAQIELRQVDGTVGNGFGQALKEVVAGLGDVVGGQTKPEAGSLLDKLRQFEEIERVLVD